MIILFGKRSQLGREFCKHSSQTIKAFNSNDFNILKYSDINSFLDKLSFKIILNFASYNEVENCDKKISNLVNAKFLQDLASYCKENDKLLIHISTDYVFDGKKGNYDELDSTNPINQYGQSKLDGENYIINSNCKYFILRTSWLYSSFKTSNNFLNKILIQSSIDKEHQFYGANDVFGSPTSCSSLVLAINVLLQKVLEMDFINIHSEIYHVVNDGRASRFDFMKEALFLLKKKFKIKSDLVEVSNDYFPSKISRPKDTVLKNSKFCKDFNFQFLSWKDALSTEVSKL